MDVVDSQLMAHVDHGWTIAKMELTKPQLSYLASLIREDLADGVMAWDTPEGTSLTREDIRDLCKALEPEKKEDLGLMPSSG